MEQPENCKGKTYIWLVVGFLTIISILSVLLGVYCLRANSEGCVKGLELQYQYRNETRLLQEQLRQSQETSLETEARWKSCSSDLKNLSETLKEVTSQRNYLKEENLDLTNKLKETEAALQMEREKNKTEEHSSACTGPMTYSLLLGLSLVIALLP
ncbi:bone marrow stromal antigen 2 isoform X2 [Gracilinanus agilis]|uniref:bone marrow stromal antigen 2 isoform X2 n=1 Tax=Gracilinanus agilis TaxID=191870 RepID=UPI001CFC73CE|nr:bone marrow stromal antigen 2 isoform X2 [Gracilinanus agilis]